MKKVGREKAQEVAKEKAGEILPQEAQKTRNG